MERDQQRSRVHARTLLIFPSNLLGYCCTHIEYIVPFSWLGVKEVTVLGRGKNGNPNTNQEKHDISRDYTGAHRYGVPVGAQPWRINHAEVH